LNLAEIFIRFCLLDLKELAKLVPSCVSLKTMTLQPLWLWMWLVGPKCGPAKEEE